MGLQMKNFSVTGKSSGGGITYTYILRVTENSIDIQKNTSSITVQAILKQNYSGTAFQNWNTGVSCTLNGKQVFSDYQKRKLEGKTEHIYYTWTGDVAHNDNGALALTVGGKLWQGSYASYSPPEMTIAENSANAMTLTAIPRASTIRAADGAVGSCATVVVNRKSTGFTHSIGYRFGNLSGYLDAQGNPVATEVKLTETTLNFLLPESFYQQIPDAPWEICTLTCRTYSGSTQIGSAQTGTFRVIADESLCKPVVTGSVKDANPLTVQLTGNDDLLVRYVSIARCQIEAQAKNSAHIVEKRIGGKSVTDDTLDIAQPDFDTLAMEAVDSRGYVGTCQIPASCIPYVMLTNNATVQRTDPTSGNAVLTLQGSCWQGNFGAAENTLTATVQVNDEPPQQLQIAVAPNHRYLQQVALSGLDYTRSHSVTVTVEDRAMSVPLTLPVQKGIPVFDWGESDFTFHVPVDVESLSVGGVSLADYIKSIVKGA